MEDVNPRHGCFTYLLMPLLREGHPIKQELVNGQVDADERHQKSAFIFSGLEKDCSDLVDLAVCSGWQQ